MPATMGPAPATSWPIGLLAGWRVRGLVGWRVALLFLLVFAAALALRLVGIANDTDVSDEGIRGLQLRLMAAGFRPVSEIYASQGPLSLVATYPLYRLFGADIVAARLAVVCYAMLALLGVAWLGARVAGPLGGVAAAGLLAWSPSFLQGSRLALVEIPSLAPTLFAVGLIPRYRETGKRVWLAASAVLLALGVLAKPMAGIAAGAVLVLLLAGRPRSGGRAARSLAPDLAVYLAAGAVTVGLAVLAVGPGAVYEQIVEYRLAARATRGWDLAANWAVIRDELWREGAGLLALGCAGALALRRRPLEFVTLLAWLAGGLALLLVYSPLWPKHVVYLLPPLALLGGAAVPAALEAVRALPRPVRPGPVALAALASVCIYLAGGPALAGQVHEIATRQSEGDLARYADDLRVISAATAPSDFVVVDDAYLALRSGRLVPPNLADLSWNRIRARALTAEQAIAQSTRFSARALVVQDDHLGLLPRFLSWADREYVLVKSYLQRRPSRFRRVYVAPGVDLDAVRAVLSASLETPLRADLGPVALLGYTLERGDLKTGTRLVLTLHWQALVDRPPEHHFVVRLRDPAGHGAQESTWRFGEGSQELESWPAGRWQFQTVRVLLDDDLPAGSYSLTVGLDRPDEGPTRIRSISGGSVYPNGTEVDLGTVVVR